MRIDGVGDMGKIWLAEWGEQSLWRRMWAKKRRIGETAVGDEVWLLEVPFARENKRTGRWLAARLKRIERIERRRQKRGEKWRLGLPCDLAEVVGDRYPQVLAAGRSLMCREFVRRLAKKHGGLVGREVGVLGLDENWQGELVRELLRCGAQVAVQGAYAERLAAELWRGGVALPVVSARKIAEVCEIMVVLPGRGMVQAAEFAGQREVFAEPPVFVAGRFVGEYAFNMFPAGMAAAMV